VLRLALVGFVARLALGVVLALAVAFLLALVRDDGSFSDSLRIALWLVGCLLLLLAPAGSSPAFRAGTLDPWLASFFPRLVPVQAAPYSGTRVSSTVLFLLAGLALFALAVVLE
jgi:hypothetical protein